MEHNINNNQQAGGGRGLLPYNASVFGKVQAKTNVKPNDQEREEKGEKDASRLPKLGWLATYVGYLPCVSLCPY